MMSTKENTVRHKAFPIDKEKTQAQELDQFYTNPKVSKRFVEKIDELYGFDNFDFVIEPSMGEGFIYNFLPTDKRIGLDLEKNHPDCLEGDFLEWTPEKSGITWEPLLQKTDDMIFVGNPPFGRNSSLALEFFERCSYYSDVVCFIIPRTWMKFIIHRNIPSDFGLYWQAVLPDASFIHNDKPYEVRCVAQCWSRFDPRPDLDIEGYEDWRDMDVSIDAKSKTA
jgi:hypothetical protein